MRNRYVCIHGHFYQPPREDPWTGRIERQPSAAPDHDWNARISRECYIPNGAARVVGAGGKTLAVVNNYEHLSFNFGPTLLSWLEGHRPEAYRRLLEADQDSARRLDGHGNAIAQAYNHAILPLANARDQVTQVRWGLEDFRHRFGREPEALWLPETACDEAVLQVLIDHGLTYAILAPRQAARVRALGPHDWKPSDESTLDSRHPYRWFDPRSARARHIDVFFYHGALSSAVAFERLMASSQAAADRIASAFDPHPRSSQLVSLCADGETYGHHEKFADMGLAHLFKHEFHDRGLPVVNYGYYLSRHHPAWEVEIRKGGTSWSCAHGLARWSDDCGCGAEGRHQRWRRPLREAFDWLRDTLAARCEKEAGPLLRDLWEARNDYIQVVLDPGRRALEAFLAKHLRARDSAPARRDALRLMEIQRHAMLIYTSCAWFFSELSGVEAVQNLKYAARAVELAREAFGEDLEPGLVRLLKRAPSNDPRHSDGEGVYRRLVLAASGRRAGP